MRRKLRSSSRRRTAPPQNLRQDLPQRILPSPPPTARVPITRPRYSEAEESCASEEANESDEDSDSGMAGIACASSPVTNFFGNPSSNDETHAYCFMAKASKEKASSKHHKVHSSDKYSSDEDAHAKLIKIDNIQQKSLEKLTKPSGSLKGSWLRRWRKTSC